MVFYCLVSLGGHEKIISLCVGTFDDKKGPQPVYSYGVSSKTAKKIVLKVMLGAFSFRDKEYHKPAQNETILTFQEEDLVAFSTFFETDCNTCRGKKKPFSLSALFPLAEQKRLYRYAGNLSMLLKKLGAIFENTFQQYGEFPPSFLATIQKLLEQNIHTVSVTCLVCYSRNEIFAFNFEDTTIFLQEIHAGDICPHDFSIYFDKAFKILLYKYPKTDLKEISIKLAQLKSRYNHLIKRG
ncbi:MAG: hypothetical protein K9W42_13815 [Candidatus Heimdallarchaeota archaeon]|nr:hypothetical protein [Candidatus Heimdallarchaeota archaeon]